MPVVLTLLTDGRLERTGSADVPPAHHGTPAPFNDGRGDARSTIRPNVPAILDPSVPMSGPGSWIRLEEWLSGTVDPADRAGVVLMPSEDPLRLAGRLDGLAALAVEFPRPTDGRGYSLARLIRQRLGWTGPLAATGKVHRDQLYLMARVGFDRFVLPPGEDADTAGAGLSDFSAAYPHSGDTLPNALAAQDAVLPARIAAATRLLRAAVARHGAGQLVAVINGTTPEDRILAHLLGQIGSPIAIATLGGPDRIAITARHGPQLAEREATQQGSRLVYNPLADWSEHDIEAFASSAPSTRPVVAVSLPNWQEAAA